MGRPTLDPGLPGPPSMREIDVRTVCPIRTPAASVIVAEATGTPFLTGPPSGLERCALARRATPAGKISQPSMSKGHQQTPLLGPSILDDSYRSTSCRNSFSEDSEKWRNGSWSSTLIGAFLPRLWLRPGSWRDCGGNSSLIRRRRTAQIRRWRGVFFRRSP